jgi:DNA-binding transcriptional LysR family regulator
LREWRFRDSGGIRDISVTGNFTVNSGVALYEAVLAGLGIARVSKFLVDQALQLGRLIQILSEYEAESEIGIYAIFPSKHYLLPKVQCFVEFLALIPSDRKFERIDE